MTVLEDHYVYVIAVTKPGQNPGPVKIGITSNVVTRLATLQTACPYPLTLVHHFAAPSQDIAREIERGFHEVQKRHRTSGEWFDMNPGVALFLMCMNIEVLLHYRTDIRGNELETALKLCGVDSAKEKMARWAQPNGGAA